VRRDFENGIRAGITGTPAAFVGGQASREDIPEALRALTLP
jgi:protein-disulfide isomerase